jgi:hypothetical protein
VEKDLISRYVLYPFNAVAVLALLLQIMNIAFMHKAWPFFLGLVYAIAFALQQFILLVRMGIR